LNAAERRQFVVVGCGLLGLSAAVELARRGNDVVALEMAEVGHEWSGSKGSSRVFRLAYDDPLYVAMAREALPLWRELEVESGSTLLRTAGLLSFGAGLDELASAMSAAGGAPELLEVAAVRERYPALRISGRAVFDPDAGVLAASDALSALGGVAAQHGVEARSGAGVLALEAHDRGVRVRTASQDFEADVVVVCAGPGTSVLVECDTFATLEQVAWFPVPEGDLPCVTRRDMPDGTVEVIGVYGLPDGGGTYKFGLHRVGPRITLGEGPLEVDEEMLAQLRSAAAPLIEGFDPNPTKVERCVYDNTTDGHFILDRVGQVVIGAGTSGHGFKFGPLLGRVLADLASGTEPSFDLRRFSINRTARRG
jgi:sarcosine oxidase